RSRRKLSEGPGWGVLSAFAETGVSSRLSARERRYASRNAPPGPALTEDVRAGRTSDKDPLGKFPRKKPVVPGICPSARRATATNETGVTITESTDSLEGRYGASRAVRRNEAVRRDKAVARRGRLISGGSVNRGVCGSYARNLQVTAKGARRVRKRRQRGVGGSPAWLRGGSLGLLGGREREGPRGAPPGGAGHRGGAHAATPRE